MWSCFIFHYLSKISWKSIRFICHKSHKRILPVYFISLIFSSLEFFYFCNQSFAWISTFYSFRTKFHAAYFLDLCFSILYSRFLKFLHLFFSIIQWNKIYFMHIIQICEHECLMKNLLVLFCAFSDDKQQQKNLDISFFE